jgi:hypothetical protein
VRRVLSATRRGARCAPQTPTRVHAASTQRPRASGPYKPGSDADEASLDVEWLGATGEYGRVRRPTPEYPRGASLPSLPRCTWNGSARSPPAACDVRRAKGRRPFRARRADDARTTRAGADPEAVGVCAACEVSVLRLPCEASVLRLPCVHQKVRTTRTGTGRTAAGCTSGGTICTTRRPCRAYSPSHLPATLRARTHTNTRADPHTRAHAHAHAHARTHTQTHSNARTDLSSAE